MNVKGTQTFKHSPSFTVEIKVSPEQKSMGFFLLLILLLFVLIFLHPFPSR